MVGLAMVLFWIVVAISAPILTPYSPVEQDRTAANQGRCLATLWAPTTSAVTCGRAWPTARG